MSNTLQQLQQLGQEWAAAELRADVNELEKLLATDFTGVGPLGFVLNRQQWLGRHQSGDFKYQSLSWEDVQIRDYGDCAVAIGQQPQEATYQGQPSNGRYRVTQVWVRQGGDWKLAGLHLSPIAQGPR